MELHLFGVHRSVFGEAQREVVWKEVRVECAHSLRGVVGQFRCRYISTVGSVTAREQVVVVESLVFGHRRWRLGQEEASLDGIILSAAEKSCLRSRCRGASRLTESEVIIDPCARGASLLDGIFCEVDSTSTANVIGCAGFAGFYESVSVRADEVFPSPVYH